MNAVDTTAVDDALATTRSVRRGLDLSRSVARRDIVTCLELAMQAPTGSNMQNWSFHVVTDAGARRGLADAYRRGWRIYERLPFAAGNLRYGDRARDRQQQGVMASARHLAEHFEHVPAMVIPCLTPRVSAISLNGVTPTADDWVACSLYGSVLQASWSFQLAARARGLATCWTTIHLLFEEEAAAILGLPFAETQQVGLIAVGHPTTERVFRRADREPPDRKIRWY